MINVGLELILRRDICSGNDCCSGGSEEDGSLWLVVMRSLVGYGSYRNSGETTSRMDFSELA